VKKPKQAITLVFCVTLLLLSLAACNTAPATPGTTTPGAIEPGEALAVTLVADFRNGSSELDQREIPWEYEGDLDIATLATALSDATGLDFFVDGKIEGDKAFVAWLNTSTLVAGLDDREQNEDFFFYDATSLNWFMLDSLAGTIKKNIPEIKEVYYSGEDGEPLVCSNPEDMAAQGLVLPVDQYYESSAFFLAHADGRGEIDDEGDAGEGRGDLIDDADDPAYWDGFNFGPNLAYAEEYQYLDDPGASLNPAEAAKLVFETCKDNGNIPEYSDATEYQMVLVDLTDIEGEDCYVYRLDVDEPTGTIGAAYAYAYQSGAIYMEGQGSQWVPLTGGGDGRGDLLDDAGAGVDWDGFDFGPNLAYAEEYEYLGDPGDYVYPHEGAKITFHAVKDNEYITGYSDSVEYKMTLVDITDIDGKECFVYRCDGEDDFAAGFAYDYQGEGIYMQGQGGQWVLLTIE
jgi:hypothetical protein